MGRLKLDPIVGSRCYTACSQHSCSKPTTSRGARVESSEFLFFYFSEMALNAASHSTTAIDIIDGTVTEYYNLMDDAMRKSEVMPGRYNIITSPSYANPCPVAESSFTTVDINCGQPTVISLENSYITAQLKVKLRCDKAHAYASGAPQTYFIGFKSSLDAVTKYQIYTNGKLFYDQPFCGEESFVIQTIVPDHVKYTRSEQFSTLKRVKEMDTNVCGTYFTLQDVAANKDFEVIIPIKLDITQFLTFQEFKYLPGFFGTWSIRLWFGSTNLVMAVVDPTYSLKATGWTYTDPNKPITPRFVQIGQPIRGITGFTAATSSAAAKVKTELVRFNVANFTADSVELNVAQFTLIFAVYDALKARYMQSPLAIPLMQLAYTRFSGAMLPQNAFSSTYSSNINCCEAMFILPLTSDQHHTVCRNPRFEGMFLNIGGYGNFPQQSVSTYPKPGDTSYTRFLTMTLDALNVNNSSLMSMTESLSASLRDCMVPHYTIGKSGDQITSTSADKGDYTQDDTNFLIGIPFSNSEDFQGGLMTNGQSSFKFSVSNSQFHPEECDNEDTDRPKMVMGIGPTVMFLYDRVILLQTLPYSEQPNVKLVEERL